MRRAQWTCCCNSPTVRRRRQPAIDCRCRGRNRELRCVRGRSGACAAGRCFQRQPAARCCAITAPNIAPYCSDAGSSTVVNVPGTRTLTAEIRYAMSQEMAVHLDDVVMRRTDLAAGSHPGRAALLATAAEMGRQLPWSAERLHQEIAATERNLQRHLARDSTPRVALSNTDPRSSVDVASATAPLSSDGAMLAETVVRATA